MPSKPRKPPRKRAKSSVIAAPAAASYAERAPEAIPQPLLNTSVVVGIGASAGGLQALKPFFAAVPADTGLAFIVVVHLDPTHDSVLPELLARETSMHVEVPCDRQVIQPNHVYIIPPNRHLTIDQGLIRVHEPLDGLGLRGTIDHFFRSLAQDLHERAIGIILSGIGTEGALGATAIKAEGGMVMAQLPESAGQSGMPANTIATGLADFILPPEKMPEALLDYIRHPYLRGHVEPGEAERRPLDTVQSIVALLRGKGIDFRGYKKGTLQRRIERRMGLQQIKSVRRYVEYLKNTSAEVDLLFKDLLIGVTSFFRDAPAFEELNARVLSKLIAGNGEQTPIRIWVPGCATGEEAYSLAILAAEQAAVTPSPRRVQIFATDIDEGALETARAGLYPESIALDVSVSRLSRFFVREDHRYRITKTIRDMVVFAAQNLISDPPFSKLDLISCRNVLIYLEPDVQRKLFALFHFALNPGGHLLLGASESTGDTDDLFSPVMKRWRLYTRLGPTKRPSMDIPFPQTGRVPGDGNSGRPSAEPTLTALAEHQLLAHFRPAAVVVNGEGRVLHLSGPMNKYLDLPTGVPTLDLATLARDPLKPIVRAVLHDGVRRRRRTSMETSFTAGRKSSATLRVTVSPLRGTREEESLSLVIFEELVQPPRTVTARAAGKQHRDIVHKLEAELKMTRREQQSLVVQLESSNQELKAANEEVTSMNEELQSTNEELESSQEELQSMNEELSTVNAQLQEKVHELTAVNDDLTNLLAATDIATVFVDADFRVSRFTAAAMRLLNLIPSDVGRPIGHLANNLVDFEMSREAESVLRSRTQVEKSVQARDGRHYIVRVLPYMREGKDPQGVVVTLTDVTALKLSEQDLRLLNQTLEERIRDRTRHLLMLHDVARTISDASNWDDALHGVLRRICSAERWQIGYVYLQSEGGSGDVTPVIRYLESERFQTFDSRTPRRVPRGEGIVGHVFAEGRPIWMEDQHSIIRMHPTRATAIKELGLQASVALPLSSSGETVAVLELFSTAPQHPGTELSHLLNDVGAQISSVIDRERTMSQAAALVWREQQSLVHTLHDSIGQQLTALGMLSAGLSKRLADDEPDIVEIANQIAVLAQESMEQVRRLSRGLFPVEVDADGLAHALGRLVSTTSNFADVRVIVEEVGRVQVRDNRVATELYRIAQEAVSNALKHANARSIIVRLVAEPGTTILSVADDGRGVRTQGRDEQTGVGLRIMRYRAQSIGASLTIDSSPDEGTIVTCLLRENPMQPSSTPNEE